MTCRKPSSDHFNKWGGIGAAVQIGSTEVETVATCLRLTQAGSVMFAPQKNDQKPMWNWYLGRINDVYVFLQQVLPYLTGKHDRARRALRIIEETKNL